MAFLIHFAYLCIWEYGLRDLHRRPGTSTKVRKQRKTRYQVMKEIMNIALVAHDSRKKEILEWVGYNAELLSTHNLYATGTTGKLISELSVITKEGEKEIITRPFKDKVTCLLSGPLGGDQQIGAMIATKKIDMLIFFCDNLVMQGHQNDVSALTRLASLYNIAFATNRTTADMLLTSTLLGDENYKRQIPDCIQDYANRHLDEEANSFF